VPYPYALYDSPSGEHQDNSYCSPAGENIYYRKLITILGQSRTISSSCEFQFSLTPPITAVLKPWTSSIAILTRLATYAKGTALLGMITTRQATPSRATLCRTSIPMMPRGTLINASILSASLVAPLIPDSHLLSSSLIFHAPLVSYLSVLFSPFAYTPLQRLGHVALILCWYLALYSWPPKSCS